MCNHHHWHEPQWRHQSLFGKGTDRSVLLLVELNGRAWLA
jgi:hypothetical protein